jgi:hypothetical protein
MFQQVVIGLVVLAAAGYVTWTFLSMAARQSLLDRLAGMGLFVGAARRHRARLNTPGCSNCSAAEPPPIARSRKS